MRCKDILIDFSFSFQISKTNFKSLKNVNFYKNVIFFKIFFYQFFTFLSAFFFYHFFSSQTYFNCVIYGSFKTVQFFPAPSTNLTLFIPHLFVIFFTPAPKSAFAVSTIALCLCVPDKERKNSYGAFFEMIYEIVTVMDVLHTCGTNVF